MSNRFERLFQLPPNLHSADSPVILLAGVLLKDKQSQKVIVQLKFKNISSHIIKVVKIHIAMYDAIGERIRGTKEYQYLDLGVSSGDVFGSNKAIILQNAESRSFAIESLSVVLDDNVIQNITMPLVALPNSKSLEEVLKHPELFKQFRLEINEKAFCAPQEVGDTWCCSCGEWNGSEKCSRCGVNKEKLFVTYDPVTLVESTKARLRKEKAEREAQKEKARKVSNEDMDQLFLKATIQNSDAEYSYCEQCGSQIRVGVNFCRYCGSRIIYSRESDNLALEQAPVQAENSHTVSIENSRRKNRIKYIVRDMTIIAVLLALTYGCFTYIIKFHKDHANTIIQGVVKQKTNDSTMTETREYNEITNIINRIDSLSEVTLDSFSELQTISEMYEKLPEKDKANVSNYEMLLEANRKYMELVCTDLNRRIGAACLNIDSSKVSLLEELQAEYKALGEAEKAKISNYDRLENAIIESKKLLAEDITERIIDLANGAPSAAKTTLREYRSIMNDAQIVKCLIEIGKWEAVGEAETYLMQYLKNPRSYTRYSGKCSVTGDHWQYTYKATVSLDYGAENSFGACVRDDVEIYVYYKIDKIGLSVSFTKTELTPYYKWKMVS